MKKASPSGKASHHPPPPPPPPPPPRRSTIEFDDDEYCNFKTLNGKFCQTEVEEKEFDDNDDDWDDDVESVPPASSSSSLLSRGSSSSDSGLNSQMLHFKRSGADAFLFAAAEPVPISEKAVAITSSPDGLIWKPGDSDYTCKISDPKKETKLGGMKSFMTFQLTPSFRNIQVSRRYKQFTWLYDRLNEKFTTISIPPLPERPHTAGKFEQDFISTRIRLLQLWVLRMCKHPVVSHADVFLHFLTCTDDKKWSKGKRVAEKDEFVQGRWFSTIQAPTLNSQQAEARIDQFSRFVKNMDDAVRQMTATGEHNMKKHEAFKKDYQKLGSSFVNLAKSFDLDERKSSVALTRALEKTGKAYEEIGQLFGAQPTLDMVHLLEGLQEYRGILTTFPSSISIHKESVNKVKEKVDRLSDGERKAVQRRADIITSTVLANMLYFQQERVTDFKAYMSDYLQKQIEFHTTITSNLRTALQQYEKI